ncbi:MAG: CocE/NonD family hydrolase [Proteobacteria bacterium]|nr:CocE/NonD family hydrolase [Burkholderiales bacterium]
METPMSEQRDGMQIDWDVAIEMDDGIVLRADVFRPLGAGRWPVILSSGPYAKGLAFQEGYPGNWARVVKAAPEVLEGSSNKYQNWELVDPEKWVPDGFACVRVDSRGAGRSPGYVDCWSPRETQDLALCIEWAGTRPWSNGRIGLNGISYYAMNQWQVAGLRPKHLAAMCLWEGSSDYYRELCRHGGILCGFLDSWYRRQVKSVQYGVGERGARSAVTGEPVAGPETLSEDVLERNRADLGGEAARRPLVDDYYRARMPAFDQIDVPLLSCSNWGGQGLHTRGNFEGFLRAASREKWLEVHGDTHFTHFYSNYGMTLQKRFFGHFLRDEDTGWDRQPRVSLNVRHPGERFMLRAENEWPLARTVYTRFYLHAGGKALSTEPSAASAEVEYAAMGDGITFLCEPAREPIEITGPVAARLWLSSQTTDADVFLALRLFDPAGKEVTFIGANDPRVPVGLGWLRASQRKLDSSLSRPERPWHTHDEPWPLTPGTPVELEVEIWPTCIVAPPGYRLGLTVRGCDYEFDGTDAGLPNAPYPMRGVGPFTHTDPQDRPADIFGKSYTLHIGPGMQPYLLLPVIPAA